MLVTIKMIKELKLEIEHCPQCGHKTLQYHEVAKRECLNCGMKRNLEYVEVK